MSPHGYPAPARPPVVRPLWSLAGPAFGALLTAGMLTAPIGPLGGAVATVALAGTVASGIAMAVLSASRPSPPARPC